MRVILTLSLTTQLSSELNSIDQLNWIQDEAAKNAKAKNPFQVVQVDQRSRGRRKVLPLQVDKEEQLVFTQVSSIHCVK